jgi:alkylation response protein AidB-like acyl-CoA dehydrogenase
MPEAFPAWPTPTTRPSRSSLKRRDLFFATVRKFAEETIAPKVQSMDSEQQFATGLVKQLFDLGLMGIEIPEALGGAGGSFFRCSAGH